MVYMPFNKALFLRGRLAIKYQSVVAIPMRNAVANFVMWCCLFLCQKQWLFEKGKSNHLQMVTTNPCNKMNLKPPNDELEDPETVRLEMRIVFHTRNSIPNMMHCNTH